MDERENYFNFVTGVLGIKTLLLETETLTGTPVALLLAVESLNDYTDAENELLGKMIAALKMDPQTYRVSDLESSKSVARNYTVEFLDQPTANEVNKQKVYSPRTLLKDGTLKKVAWDDLQKVIRHFKT